MVFLVSLGFLYPPPAWKIFSLRPEKFSKRIFFGGGRVRFFFSVRYKRTPSKAWMRTWLTSQSFCSRCSRRMRYRSTNCFSEPRCWQMRLARARPAGGAPGLFGVDVVVAAGEPCADEVNSSGEFARGSSVGDGGRRTVLSAKTKKGRREGEGKKCHNNLRQASRQFTTNFTTICDIL